jgi:hypothetical protein
MSNSGKKRGAILAPRVADKEGKSVVFPSLRFSAFHDDICHQLQLAKP